MEQSKLDRINFLAKKSRTGELSPDEKKEQEQLRNEYRRSVVGNLRAQLDNTYILEPDGSKRKIESNKNRKIKNLST